MSKDNLSDSKYKRKSLLEYALVVFFFKVKIMKEPSKKQKEHASNVLIYKKIFYGKIFMVAMSIKRMFLGRTLPKAKEMYEPNQKGHIYHFHYVDPEPNADTQNLELQIDGSTI